ncbi:phenylalanine--tRNA ligase subunit beta [Candidatus Aminicenantes bacterium AC-335-O07]|nr:phenylalanine--tRNA ligase subunit beta [Candidatus Aminicenantes bacterium AC-335-O07]
MKVSVKWLRELVELDCSNEELINALNKIGLMVEEIVEEEDDLILDIETYPNRPDTLGHIGIAREISTYFRTPLKELDFPINWIEESVENFVEITIKDEELCPRYVGMIVKDIKVGESPEWIRKRLESLGFRSINNIVDITNYVLLLTGHPIHAFDLEKIEGRRVIIRRAQPGERILTLEEKEEELSNEMLVIADSIKPIAIAGVIGGEESGIKEETRNVLIESAYFNPISIRKTSKKLGLITEASYRFKRGADIESPPRAARIAASLLSSFGGKVAKGLIDNYPNPRRQKAIIFRMKRAEKIIGVPLQKEFVEEILNYLGCNIDKTSQDVWQVQPPSHRIDLEREIDLIEEIARFYGYEKIPSQLPSLRITENPFNTKKERIEQIRKILISMGFDEVINYSFTSPDKDDFFKNEKNPIQLKNPISSLFSRMRTSLFPGLLQNISWNLNRGAEGISIFEIGKIYEWEGEKPKEYMSLGIVCSGLFKERYWKEKEKKSDFFILKGTIESLFEKLKLLPFSFEYEDCNYFENNFSLNINVKGEKIGYIGLIRKEIREAFEIEEDVYAVEINLESLLNKSLPPIKFKPFSKFPSIVRDLSFIIDKERSYKEIEEEIGKIAPSILVKFMLYDYYTGPPVPPGKVSMTIRFVYSHPGKTLSAEEVQVVHNRIFEDLRNKFGIKLRE